MKVVKFLVGVVFCLIFSPTVFFLGIFSFPKTDKKTWYVNRVVFENWPEELLRLRHWGHDFPVRQLVQTQVNRKISIKNVERDVSFVKDLIVRRRPELHVSVAAKILPVKKWWFTWTDSKQEVQDVDVIFTLSQSVRDDTVLQEAGQCGVLVHDMTSGSTQPDISNLSDLNSAVKKKKSVVELVKAKERTRASWRWRGFDNIDFVPPPKSSLVTRLLTFINPFGGWSQRKSKKMFTDIGVRGSKHGVTRWWSRPSSSSWWFLPSFFSSERVFDVEPYSLKSDFVQGQVAQNFLRKANRLGDQFFLRSSFLSNVPFLPNIFPVIAVPPRQKRKVKWTWARLRAQADSQSALSTDSKVKILQPSTENDEKKSSNSQKEDFGWWAPPERGNADLASLRYVPADLPVAPVWNIFAWDEYLFRPITKVHDKPGDPICWQDAPYTYEKCCDPRTTPSDKHHFCFVMNPNASDFCRDKFGSTLCPSYERCCFRQIQENEKVYGESYIVNTLTCSANSEGVNDFLNVAESLTPVPDKVHGAYHSDLWVAEFDEECVNNYKHEKLGSTLHLVVGDQRKPEVVKGWVEESGGGYDVVIDDGYHTNDAIRTSFHGLWPYLKPGGLYFIEDLYDGYAPRSQPHKPFMDSITTWMSALVTQKLQRHGPDIFFDHSKKILHTSVDVQEQVGNVLLEEDPMPLGLEFITCFQEACVLGKSVII